MQITQFVANNTLLNYSLMTTPAPLQVSPQSGPPSVATLSFVISCPFSLAGVTVTQIAFNLPVGDPTSPDASDLTEVSTGISASVTSSGTDKWQIGPGANPGSFILKPAGGTPAKISEQGLTVSLGGIQVSPIVGNAEVDIAELATADNTPPQSRDCAVNVPKFPYGFYAGNFTASAPMVQDGATVVLSWIGSVQATYTLLWGTQSQNVSTVNQWTSPALTDTTTFILEVAAQEGGQTVKLYFSITVIVADPNITATTIEVLQTSQLDGNVTVGTTAANANLNVNGTAAATVVNAGTLGVSGAGTLGSLAVTNAATIGSIQTPSLNATAATVGTATVTNLNARAGQVAMITNSVPLTPGSPQSPASFQALTDGFAVCYIGTVPSYPTGGCVCWGSAYANGITLQCTGGNTGFFGPSWDAWMANNPNSFVLPVPAGSNFYMWVQEMSGDGQQVNAPYNFYWVPMGNTNGPSLAFLDKPGPDFVPPTPARAEIGEPRARRMEFITILERLLGKPIDAVTRQQLIAALGGS